MDSNDHIISAIPYITVNRTIEWNEQKYIKTEHNILLYEDKISTSSHQFNHETVFDISYRAFSEPFGILYLHTNQGVFAYEVNTDPYSFMEKVKHFIK